MGQYWLGPNKLSEVATEFKKLVIEHNFLLTDQLTDCLPSDQCNLRLWASLFNVASAQEVLLAYHSTHSAFLMDLPVPPLCAIKGVVLETKPCKCYT